MDSEHTSESIDDRKEMMRAYLREIWGGKAGQVAAPALFEGHGRGTYQGKWVEGRAWAFPANEDGFLDWAVANSAAADIYVAPMLRTGLGRRSKSSGAGSFFSWCDVDGEWTRERDETWRNLVSEGDRSFVVASGSGRHLYLDLGEWTGVDEVEAINRRLAVAVDGDAKWSNEAVLRLPGTFWHKSRCSCSDEAVCQLDGPSKLVRRL